MASIFAFHLTLNSKIAIDLLAAHQAWIAPAVSW